MCPTKKIHGMQIAKRHCLMQHTNTMKGVLSSPHHGQQYKQHPKPLNRLTTSKTIQIRWMLKVILYLS